MKVTRLVALSLVLICVAATAQARVTRLEITMRSDVDGGKPFGDAGPYEKIEGKLFF